MAAPLDPSRLDLAAVDGAGGGWRAYTALPVPDLAWEFLRRNADYRDAWRRLARRPAAIEPRWGLRFAADPGLSAAEASVFWRAEVAPGLVVPFEADPIAPALEPRSWIPKGVSQRAEDGLHVRLSDGLQLQYRGAARPGGAILVVLGFDRDLGLRVHAVERLHRAVAGRAPPASRLTRAQRERLAKSLAALDGALSGESYRQIAARLFGGGAVEAEAWSSSSLRATTIRLVRAGRRLMVGGYLRLVREGL